MGPWFRLRQAVAATACAAVVVSLAALFFASQQWRSQRFVDHEKYGAVPIPGSGTVHLPPGRIIISYHTQLAPGGGARPPAPDLAVRIMPAAGVTEPPVTRAAGGPTTVGKDVYRQVATTEIAQEGDYVVAVDGQVDRQLSPRLAFGYQGWRRSYLVRLLVGACAVLCMASVVLYFAARNQGWFS